LLAYGSNLARVLFPGFFVERLLPLESLRRQVGYGTAAWRDAIAERYVANLVRGSRIARGCGALFMAFFQPTIHFKRNLSAEERDFKDKFGKSLAANSPGDFDMHTIETRSRVRVHLAALHGEPTVVDLSDTFADTSEWIFADFIHLRPEANAKIAAVIRSSLLGDPSIRTAFERARTDQPRHGVPTN
jgi:hypothetical protein